MPCLLHGFPPGAVLTPGPHMSVIVTSSSPSCSHSQFKVVSLSLPTFCWHPFLSSWPRPAVLLVPGGHAASWLPYLTYSPAQRLMGNHHLWACLQALCQYLAVNILLHSAMRHRYVHFLHFVDEENAICNGSDVCPRLYSCLGGEVGMAASTHFINPKVGALFTTHCPLKPGRS